jgi:hypothetical protein
MIIEFVLFVALTIVVGAAIVKLYEWHQKVPLGQQVKRRD